PLDRGGADRFLPWIVAPMTYLATLCLALTLALGGLVDRWDRGLTGALTVQLPAVEGEAARATALEDARAVLAFQPGIARIEPVDRDEAAALVEPWLGDAAALEDLPLPTLIDVRLERGADIDVAGLSAALARAVPGAQVIDHGRWLRDLVRFAGTVRAVAGVILFLVAGAAVATIVSATRAGLAVHASVVEILHLMGAPDAFISRQFERHFRGRVALGGAVGLVAAAATLLVLGRAARGLGGALAPDLTLGPWAWAALVAVPLAAVGLAMATARAVVRDALGRMP
ncbi:MAG: hypothetical protein RID91_18055, partial [Azospirillaceae bacterium]